MGRLKARAREKGRERVRVRARARARIAQKEKARVKAKVAQRAKAKGRAKEKASPRGRWRMKQPSIGWYGSFDQVSDCVFVSTSQCLQQPSLKTALHLCFSGATLACFSREHEAVLTCLYLVKQSLQGCGCA